MADASDSKSDVGNHVWVQVPSPAFLFYGQLKVVRFLLVLTQNFLRF